MGSANIKLILKYLNAIRSSWKDRHLSAPKTRTYDEFAFLPAALELQERPTHPAPHYFLWGIITLSGIALVWSMIGRIDVIATGSGKIIPSGNSKIIQSSETAVVKAIYVHDGQTVKKGELLLELDNIATTADIHRFEGELLAAQIDDARAKAMLDSISSGLPPNTLRATIPNASTRSMIGADRWLNGQYQEYRNGLDTIDAEIRERRAEVQSAKSQVNTLMQSLPIARQLSLDYARLLEKQYVARHEYLEKEQTRLEIERQLHIQEATSIQSAAALDEAKERRQGIVAQTRREMLDLLQQADQKITSITEDLAKARYLQDLTTLESPVDGIVQELKVHTVGGVVTPAQNLLTIVPLNQPVEVEAMLENKDIGFVHLGQSTTIKVETFNFTKYGTISGTISNISGDAIEDEKRGLIYSTKIKLDEDSIIVNGQKILLSPGMAVTAEIKTDSRRILDYFLSPLYQNINESIRER